MTEATTTPTPPPETDGLPWPQRLYSVIAISIAICVMLIDTNIANVALPTIAADLKASPADALWVVNAYQLAVMLVLLPAASLSDIYGYRRCYIVGLSIFTLASLLCGLSVSIGMLTVMRVVQGVGAGFVMSNNAALLRATYPRAKLGLGVGINAFVVATSAAAGPSIASAILSITTWPWLFLVNVPLGVLAVTLAIKFMQPSRRTPHRFDWLSAILNALTFGLLIVGIDGLGHGENLWLVGGGLLAAVVFGALFVWRQQSIPFPMLPVALLLRPILGLSCLTSTCSFIGQSMALVAIPFYFEYALHFTEVQTGLLMTPWPLCVAVVAPISGRFADKVPIGIIGGIGLGIMSLGLLLVALLPADPSAANVIWRMVVCGFGYGIFQAPNNRAIIAATPRERSGSAGGFIATSRLLGQTTGTALVSLIFGSYAASAVGPGASLAVLIGAGIVAAGAGVSSFRLMNRPQAEDSIARP